ncbi:MAG TPA: amidohydrolase family protein [Chloroflexota bacterium]|nr:amidohydrolase family protein [Chloroflexota bacterium]
MTTELRSGPTAQAPARAITIDCDIHHAPTDDVLERYLPARWRRHRQLVGGRYPFGYLYPKSAPQAARTDAWPPGGGPPGSNLDLLREQVLDRYAIQYGILNCLHDAAYESNPQFAVALARAINDWTLTEWLEREPRLRAAIVVPYEYAEEAAAEIERVGAHPGFVQVLLLVRSREPFGQRRYWPIYEAAQRHGLPVAIHFGGRGGNPITGCGWPSYYIEDHAGMAQAFQAQLVSLVAEGVFVRFPALKVLLLEGGFAWLPPLMWRLDRGWQRLREEIPELTQAPSAYIRQHISLSTQPMEEPAQPHHLRQLIESVGLDDMLLFATDYPHWDFDDPLRAFPVALPADVMRKIMGQNARALYGL